jgi:hypothetical protein
VGLFEEFLKGSGVSEGTLGEIEEQVTQEVEAGAEEALSSKDRSPAAGDAEYAGFSEGGTLVGLLKRPL